MPYIFLEIISIYLLNIKKNLIDACPSRCYTCNGGTCKEWCSKYNYCGSSDAHKETDCRACTDGIQYILFFVISLLLMIVFIDLIDF